MNAFQKGSFPLAGLLAKVSPGNLSKPDIHSAKNLALCLTAANSILCKAASYTGSAGYYKQLKNRLPSPQTSDYPQLALAKFSAGIGVLRILLATHDAPGVFFCVVRLTHPFFWQSDIIRCLSRAMVAQAGEPKGSPVSSRAGYANPVWATTSEIGVSGGSVTRYLLEAAIMATTLTQAIPKFQFRFLALSRADMLSKPCRVSVEAASEKEARRVLAPHFILSLAARLPVQEVAHA
ncbi:host cell division inhibitor Icd-like protein [Erwinia sp. ACCC 02193]|uniref:Host cell division inhibitor Icd-like protein n=1 Tax=Erwinia aeris TaxID=3239803 RepID=A0ABV4EBD5_9GAMM